jgi:hypothetical protein
MYDRSTKSELIRFARVEAGSTVIDVYPGDGDWTRLFSDIVGPEGRVYSFVPAEGYPQTPRYKWWNWHDSYVPGGAVDPTWDKVSDAGEAAFRKGGDH